MNDADKARILEVLDTVSDMTIATLREDGFPQASTVSYVNDDLAIYFGTSERSQKSVNIARDDRVSLTVNRPYRFWKDILGLSLGGRASRVSDPAEYRRVGRLLFERFPEVNEYASLESEEVALFRVDPVAISLLDYRLGFGHSREFTLA